MDAEPARDDGGLLMKHFEENRSRDSSEEFVAVGTLLQRGMVPANA
jgi:hypothetical protein